MDTVKRQMLGAYEGRMLRSMKHQLANAVNRLLARTILLSRGGCTNVQIVEHCGCTAAWVRTIIHRFNHGGIDVNRVSVPCRAHARECLSGCILPQP